MDRLNVGFPRILLLDDLSVHDLLHFVPRGKSFVP